MLGVFRDLSSISTVHNNYFSDQNSLSSVSLHLLYSTINAFVFVACFVLLLLCLHQCSNRGLVVVATVVAVFAGMVLVIDVVIIVVVDGGDATTTTATAAGNHEIVIVVVVVRVAAVGVVFASNHNSQ